MLWEPQAFSAVRRVAKASRDAASYEYLRTCTMLVDFFEGDHLSWLVGTAPTHPDDYQARDAILKRAFPNAFADDALEPQTLPFLQKLIAVLASALHRQPGYVFLRNGERIDPTQGEGKALAEVLKQVGFHDALKRIHHRGYLLRTCFAGVRQAGRTIKIDVATPDRIDVAESVLDPTDLQTCTALCHEVSHTEAGRLFMVWRRNPDGKVTCQPVDVFGLPKAIPGFEPPVFADYPFVVYHPVTPTDSIYATLEDSFTTAQIGMDVMWTDYMLARKMAGGFVHQDGVDTVKHVAMSRDRIYCTEGGVKVEFIARPQNLAEMLQFAEAYQKTYAVLHGAHPDLFDLNGNNYYAAISAASKQLDRIDLQETRQEQRTKIERLAEELFGIVRMVWNDLMVRLNEPGRKIADDLELLIEWPKPQEVGDPLALAQAKQARMNAGLTNPVKELLAENEGMTPDEAEWIAEINLAWKARMAEVVGQRQTTPPEGGNG
jgi:hypothetical protein